MYFALKSNRCFFRRRRGRRGAAAVELALVLPVYLLLLAGIVEFGQYFRIQHLLSTASRRGARAAVISGATTSQVQTKVTALLETTLNVSKCDIQVEVAVSGNPQMDLSGAEQGDEILVTVSIPYSKAASSFFGCWFSKSSISSSCALEHE